MIPDLADIAHRAALGEPVAILACLAGLAVIVAAVAAVSAWADAFR